MASVLAISIYAIATASMRRHHRKNITHPIKDYIILELDMTIGNRLKGISDSLGGSCDDAGKKD
jgi:hypothetical protein